MGCIHGWEFGALGWFSLTGHSIDRFITDFLFLLCHSSPIAVHGSTTSEVYCLLNAFTQSRPTVLEKRAVPR